MRVLVLDDERLDLGQRARGVGLHGGPGVGGHGGLVVGERLEDEGEGDAHRVLLVGDDRGAEAVGVDEQVAHVALVADRHAVAGLGARHDLARHEDAHLLGRATLPERELSEMEELGEEDGLHALAPAEDDRREQLHRGETMWCGVVDRGWNRRIGGGCDGLVRVGAGGVGVDAEQGWYRERVPPW